MNAVILARVSTEEQKEAGNSLPAQTARMEAYCQGKGFKVVDRDSFDESAYGTKRDKFDLVIKRLSQSKETVAVCFDKVDRFSRNVFDKRVSALYEMAVSGKIQLHFVSDNLVIDSDMSAPQKFHFSINLGLAKYYSDAISDNVRRSFEQKRRRGEWTGRAPLGYMHVKGETLPSDIVPDPDTAHIVRRLFELYATGQESTRTIQAKAHEMGLRGRSGRRLSSSMTDYLLNNPFYYGEARVNELTYPHKYAPLISKELFDKCQEVRHGWGKKPFKYASKSFMFRGLIRCGRCGCALSPEIKKGKYVYYSCTNARKDVCDTKVYIPEKDLLKPVRGVLEALAHIPQEAIDRLVEALKKAHKSKTLYHEQQIRRLQTEYIESQTRLDRLMDLMLDGSITKADHDKKLKELKDRQYDLGLQLEEYTKADENYAVTAATVLNLAKNALKLFDISEVDEKRAILGFMLQNCVLVGKELKFDLKKPFDSIAVAAKKAASLKTESSALGAACPTWLGDLDSNQDKQIQSLLSYH